MEGSSNGHSRSDGLGAALGMPIAGLILFGLFGLSVWVSSNTTDTVVQGTGKSLQWGDTVTMRVEKIEVQGHDDLPGYPRVITFTLGENYFDRAIGPNVQNHLIDTKVGGTYEIVFRESYPDIAERATIISVSQSPDQ